LLYDSQEVSFMLNPVTHIGVAKVGVVWQTVWIYWMVHFSEFVQDWCKAPLIKYAKQPVIDQLTILVMPQLAGW